MNYIGSKITLMPFVDGVIKEVVGTKIDNLTDLFAGTGAVGSNFKKQGVEVTSNDIQYYSYVLNRHLIGNDNELKYAKLVEVIPQNSMSLFDANYQYENIARYLENIEGQQGFIYNNYSQSGTEGNEYNRLYFSDDNAKMCDAIRIKIEDWYNDEIIDEDEYFALLASLIESIDKYANTTSVYGAYLKQLKQSARKRMQFSMLPNLSNGRNNRVFNEDANELINRISGQILYLDPPYNHRQYATNYHLLETIARYDCPMIHGKTGLRDYKSQKSKYCMKSQAIDSFEELIMSADFEYVFLSYNNEGIIPIESIEKIMKRRGEYKVFTTNYNRYKADNGRDYKDTRTTEYLHCLKIKR